MSLFSGLASVGKAILSGVSSSVKSTITTGLGLSKKIFNSLAIAEVAVDLAVNIAQKLGVIDNEQDINQLGDKVLQAKDEGINLDEYDHFEEYKKEIENFRLDKKKSLKFKEEEKELVGFSFILKDLGNFYGIDVSKYLNLIKDKPELLEDSDKVMAYLEGFSKEGIGMDMIEGYYKNELGFKSLDKIEPIIEEVDKEFD